MYFQIHSQHNRALVCTWTTSAIQATCVIFLSRLSPSPTLFLLSHQRGTSPGETKLLASEIYEILQAAGKEEAEQAEAAAASCQRKAHFFLGSNNKRAKTVVLHIDGLDDPVSVHGARPGLNTTHWRASIILRHTKRLLMHKNLILVASCSLLSLSQCCQCSLAVSVWHRTGGWRGQVVNVSHWTAGC